MSVCDSCRKKTYCKKTCRPAREERTRLMRQVLMERLKSSGLVTAYNSLVKPGSGQ